MGIPGVVEIGAGSSLQGYLADPQNLNSYSYVNNNPLKYVDPLGLDKYEFNNGSVVETSRGVSDGTEITYREQDDINMINHNAEQAKHMSSIDFANNVRSGGPWDFKNSEDVVDRGREYYFFDGQLETPESFGNLHFGYTGSAAGFSRSVLTDGAGFAQLYSGTETFNPIANYDDPRDTRNINTGINSYRRNHGRTFNLERGIINTAYSNPIVKTISKTASTGWYLTNKVIKLFSD